MNPEGAMTRGGQKAPMFRGLKLHGWLVVGGWWLVVGAAS